MYPSMTFHVCISSDIKHFGIKFGGVSFDSDPRNISWDFLLLKRAHGFEMN